MSVFRKFQKLCIVDKTSIHCAGGECVCPSRIVVRCLRIAEGYIGCVSIVS
jgi:hypothetical protein